MHSSVPFFLSLLGVIACGSTHGFSGDDAALPDAAFADVQLLTDGAAPSACDTHVLQTYGPGPDGVLRTPDDVLEPAWSKVVDAQFGPHHALAYITSFDAPGPDGQWQTDDDHISEEERVVVTSPNSYDFLRLDGPGPDGAWGTDDDAIAQKASALGPVGAPTRWVSYAPGSLTVVTGEVTYVYGDGQTTPQQQIFRYSNAGPDGVWATGDEPIQEVDNWFGTNVFYSTAPGPDATWGTKDDVVDLRESDVRNVDSHTCQISTSFDKGPDGVFFTPDDVANGCQELAFHDGALYWLDHLDPGSDRIWCTPDDTVVPILRETACGCDAAWETAPTLPK